MNRFTESERDFLSVLLEQFGEHDKQKIRFVVKEVPRCFLSFGIKFCIYRFFYSVNNRENLIADFVEWDYNRPVPYALPHFFLDYESSLTLNPSQYRLFFYSGNFSSCHFGQAIWVEHLFGKIPCSVFASGSINLCWEKFPRLHHTRLRKISIVTVVKNEVEFIAQTIQSVLYQNARDRIEYLVIDGFSDDGTSEIISQYKHCIDVIVSRSDESIYAAMNYGIGLCTGDLLLFLNGGDCLASPDSMSLILESPFEIPVIAGLALNISNEGSWVRPNKRRRNKLENFSHQAIIMKPNFTFNERYRIAADHEILKNVTDFTVIPNIISFFRIGGASTGAISYVQLSERLRVHGFWGLIRLTSRWLILKMFGASAVNLLRKWSES